MIPQNLTPSVWSPTATLVLLDFKKYFVKLSVAESEIPFKKWTSLRDTMKKNVLARDQANRSGAPGESRKKLPKKYKYYDQMEWILACNKQQT